MEIVSSRSLNHQLPHDLHFNKYAQQILENSKSIATTIATTPTITTYDASANANAIESASASAASTSHNFLQILGASLINSIQLQHTQHFPIAKNLTTTTAAKMDLDFTPNHVIIDSSFNTMDELQKQLEYDKFMNEVWIGIVLTLILISMVFCICSCFLYHQFRTWKNNYNNTVAQVATQDIESLKFQTDFDDPVPEYTLVSGLPSYEAALELMRNTPKSCLLVYPSVFQVFNQNEITTTTTTANVNDALDAATTMQQQQLQQQQHQQHLTHMQHMQQQQFNELTQPLLSTTTATTTATNSPMTQTATQTANQHFCVDNVRNFLSLPSYEEANNNAANVNFSSAVTNNVKQQQQQQHQQTIKKQKTPTAATTNDNFDNKQQQKNSVSDEKSTLNADKNEKC